MLSDSKIKNRNANNRPDFAVDNKLQNKSIDNKIAENVISGIIDQNITKLCKSFCMDNCIKYQCTLEKTDNRSNSVLSLCEWGNGTYDWMLNELNHIQYQNEIKNRTILSYEHYFRKIVTSLQFWERYKNWRFNRRIRVPDYIKALDPDACKIFWGLYNQDTIDNIAQRLNREFDEINSLVTNIYTELSARKRGHILMKNKEFSLSHVNQELVNEVDSHLTDQSLETHLERESVMKAYKQLTWQEQYILDVMVIDKISALSVLKTLQNQSISLDNKIDPKELNIQNIYYFLRKTLIKLKQKSDIVLGQKNDRS